ncbi:TraM recognition domain-containing protein [Enterococcus faecalis]|uniref:TraM recognition domain-containing protein n=1 Tax=Enterococcus faecalis TaxID=1351 RepID=A0AAP6RH58_ENTFL|nr:TraM recognition domain-containing protein [Enterococcus faecalis]MXS28374.1 TraM recognition domain-containing protein [Enterococcus faecalis]MXS52853.1 TraM recognition domain-containing protein [Enterococcus faecalis]
MKKIENLVWHKLSWQRPIEFSQIESLAHHLATSESGGRKPIIFEIRARTGKICYYLASERAEFAKIKRLFKTHSVDFGAELPAQTTARKPVTVARKLTMTKPILSLKTDNSQELTRIMLATMAQVSPQDEIVIQLVIASSLPPEHVPRNLPDPSASWWDIISKGNVPIASSDTRNSIKNKVKSHRLRTMIRIGAYSQDDAKARSYILSVLSAFKMLETGGNKLNLQPEEPPHLTTAKLPWKYPCKLSTAELANFMLAPIGQDDLSGIAPIHPKILLPPLAMKDPPKHQVRAFGTTLNENEDDRRLLNLSLEQNATHLEVVGGTGSGKSIVMEHLILDQITNFKNSGCVVIDPKYSLISSILEKLPEDDSILDRIVIWDITSNRPLGLNILNHVDGKSPTQIAESVLDSLRCLFPDFGVLTEELLTCGLLTLAQSKNMTLLHLPLLFTNATFRHKLTSNLKDMYLMNFWRNFEAQSEKDRNQQLAPLLRRLNILLSRESLRGTLGQAKPKFDLEEVFTKGKILLVPLNDGMTGKTVSQLCASLLINSLWNIALRRAEIPEQDKNPVVLYIDEFQNYIKKSGASLQEQLEMGRGLKFFFCFCHQNLGQLDSTNGLKEVVMANAKNKIIFNVAQKRDAAQFADLTASQISEHDLQSLALYSCYYKIDKIKNGYANNIWLSGKTFPPKPKVRNNPADLFARSAEKYGRDIDEIEQEFSELMNQNEIPIDDIDNADIDLLIGKRTKRKQDK